MRIYNTLTRTKEDFKPITEGHVKMYVCGPTVYSYIHIGNARPLIVYDTLRRYLEHRGYCVAYAQNFTDIDDKVINRANDEGIPYFELAERYIHTYYEDADSLNVLRPTHSPRATDYIDKIISLISKLIERKHAYASENGDVYFSVRSFGEYGKLSKQPLESLEQGARVSSSEEKRDPLDFALWKSAKPGEPSWESPWGNGRPGWHIECSAMSMDILGQTFDIHAGGADLIFPHHENEIAQSEAATGVPFANYWMHNGHINIDNRKMSKSKGNFFNLRDITAEFNPEAVRLFMLSSHYASPMNFSRELIEQAQTALTRLYTAKERLESAAAAERELTAEEAEFMAQLSTFEQAFNDAMDDDLNTADAIGTLFELVRSTNAFVSEPRPQPTLNFAYELFSRFVNILGIVQGSSESEIPEEALSLMQQRTNARAARDWVAADMLRNKLLDMGYIIEDTKEGSKLKPVK